MVLALTFLPDRLGGAPRVPALGSLEGPGRSGPKASTAADHYGRSEATYGIKDSAQSVASWAIQRCSSVVSHGFAIGEGD
jgi:hypothetical protein